jgi:AcrR family transcriptional regulator
MPTAKETKKNLLQKVALDIFLQKGFHPTRIDDIVEKASVGKGTFYKYFSNKEEVVHNVLDQLFGEVFDTFQWVQDHLAPESELEDVIKEKTRRISKTLEKNKKAAQFLFREGRASGKDVEKRIKDFYLELIDNLETTFLLAEKAGLFRIGHSRVAAICILGGTLQVYHQWMEGDFKDSIDSVVMETVAFFQKALGLNLEKKPIF